MKKRLRLLQYRFFLTLMITVIFLVSCRMDDVSDTAMNVLQAEEPNILMVKGGYPVNYPNRTYGEYFEKFFRNPTWKYFKGVRTETNSGEEEMNEKQVLEDMEKKETGKEIDVVEFTGYCMFRDTEVKALIQFILDKDSDTFEVGFLSFNDVPQVRLILIALLEKVFGDEESQEEQIESYETEETANTQQDFSAYISEVERIFTPRVYYSQDNSAAIEILSNENGHISFIIGSIMPSGDNYATSDVIELDLFSSDRNPFVFSCYVTDTEKELYGYNPYGEIQFDVTTSTITLEAASGNSFNSYIYIAETQLY